MRANEVTEQPLIPNILPRVLPMGYELVPGLNSVYELELALAEARALNKEELVKRSAYFAKIDGRETYHSKMCSAPLQVGKNFRLRAFFEVFRYKTSYATHGLFPYRGKFHPQLIKAIMNIIGLKPGDKVLDPMTGSATTNIEASLIGVDSIGFDMNPFAVFMGKVKVDALSISQQQLEELKSQSASAFEKLNSKRKQKKITEHVFSLGKEDAHPLLLLCYLDALGYSRRVKSKEVEDLFPIVLDRYLAALRNFVSVRDELKLNLATANVEQFDARNLTKKVASGSIDGVVTSPPYSFAIDYLKGDSLQLEYLNYDVSSIRDRMLGLRGSGLSNQVLNYLADMDSVLSEIARVLKPSHYAVIIVGTNTVQLEKVEDATGLRLENELVKYGAKHGLELTQRFERPIEGVQNTMRSEHILFLKKG